MGPVCQADRGITNMTVLQNHFFCKKRAISATHKSFRHRSLQYGGGSITGI